MRCRGLKYEIGREHLYREYNSDRWRHEFGQITVFVASWPCFPAIYSLDFAVCTIRSGGIRHLEVGLIPIAHQRLWVRMHPSQ